MSVDYLLSTKSDYENGIKSTFSAANFHPKYLYQIKIPTPFFVPLKNKQPTILNVNRELFIAVIIEHKEIKSKLDTDPIFREAVYGDSLFSTFEINFFYSAANIKDSNNMQVENYGQFILDRSIEIINDYSITYSLLFDDFELHKLNPIMLSNHHFGRKIMIENWKIETFIISTPKIFHINKKELDAKTTDLFPKYIGERKSLHTSILNYLELSQAAIRYFNEGRFNISVITRQTSLEIWFAFIFKYFYSVEGKSNNDLIEDLRNFGISRLIGRELPHKLGGNGFQNIAGTPFYEWKELCYMLRNNIIHGEYAANADEVNKCLEVSSTFIHYTLHMINKKGNSLMDLENKLQNPDPNFKPPHRMKNYFGS